MGRGILPLTMFLILQTRSDQLLTQRSIFVQCIRSQASIHACLPPVDGRAHKGSGRVISHRKMQRKGYYRSC